MSQIVEVYGSGAFKAGSILYPAQWSVSLRRGHYSFHIFTFRGKGARKDAYELTKSLRRATKGMK